jgi:hypothetical protein
MLFFSSQIARAYMFKPIIIIEDSLKDDTTEPEPTESLQTDMETYTVRIRDQ